MDNNHYQKRTGFDCITKIQEAKPAHVSTLINKQLGYDVIIELEENQTQKIKNCICSSRPNSEIYKRISKQFISNIKVGVDQLYVFCGIDSQSRIQTSIGVKSNPGIFIITAISVLDQKYRENCSKFDVEVSFLEFKEGNIIDLLNYTGEPLKINFKNSQWQFVGSYVKICTFKQFIKLFKIALFNNKERDFKSNNSLGGIIDSTFIMRLRTSKYDNNNLVCTQESILLDFQHTKQKMNNLKTLWDYVLIEINNGNPFNKKIQYHLVQPNYLLLLLKNYLLKGQTIFVNSIPADLSRTKQNLDYLNNLKQAAGAHWQVKISLKTIYNNKINWKLIESQIDSIIKNIKQKHYSSLRQLSNIKIKCKQLIKRLFSWIKVYKNLMLKYTNTKRICKFVQNSNIADQILLIGSCVKSDHFKQFYNAKSYISLQRQVLIKTKDIRQQLKILSNKIWEFQQLFKDLKKKQILFFKFIQKNKNQIIYKQLQKIIQIILQYLYNYQQQIKIYQSRTVTDSILKDQQLCQQINRIQIKFNQFLTNLDQIGKNCSISCQQQKIICQNSYVSLLKQVKNQIQQKNIGKKLFTKLPPVTISLQSMKLSSLLIDPSLNKQI